MKIGMFVGGVALALLLGCGDDSGGMDAAVDAAADAPVSPDAGTDSGADGATDAAADVAMIDAGTCETDLVGSWGVTAIEGAPPPPPDSSNSTWIFNADGTYTWCLNYAGYVYDDSGHYMLDGAWLTVDGMVSGLTAMNPFPLFDCTADSFRFRDDEGDAWTYERDPSATGCTPP